MPAHDVRKHVFRMLLAVPVVALVVVVEIGFRISAYFEDAKLDTELQQVGSKQDVGQTKGPLRLADLIRWNPNPKIIYELIPERSGDFEGAALSINADGFRGQVVTADRNRGVFRVVGVGDSVMFGWGVADDEPYLARLPHESRMQSNGFSVETLNAAVPGYNTVMSVETVKEKLLKYRPDLVIYDYVGNDLHLPSFIRKRRPYLTLGESFLYNFVKRQVKSRNYSDRRLDHPPDAYRHRDFEEDPEAIPDRYRGLVGMAAFENTIAELATLSRVHGFRVLVFAHAGIPDPIRQVFEAHDLPALDAYPAARRYLREQGMDTFLGSPLTVSGTDPHPSSLYHAMLAQVLARYLVKQLPGAP